MLLLDATRMNVFQTCLKTKSIVGKLPYVLTSKVVKQVHILFNVEVFGLSRILDCRYHSVRESKCGGWQSSLMVEQTKVGYHSNTFD